MSKFTKAAIVNSFYKLIEQKSFEKITVKDIVDDCGINRKTFYYYFKDIYDLIEYVFRAEIEGYVETAPKGDTLEDSIIGIFALVKKNKKSVMHLRNSSHSKELKKYLHIVFNETVIKLYKDKADAYNISEHNLKLFVHVFVTSFYGILINWIDDGMKPDYEEDIKCICAMLGGSVEYMLEKLSQNSKLKSDT